MCYTRQKQRIRYNRRRKIYPENYVSSRNISENKEQKEEKQEERKEKENISGK